MCAVPKHQRLVWIVRTERVLYPATLAILITVRELLRSCLGSDDVERAKDLAPCCEMIDGGINTHQGTKSKGPTARALRSVYISCLEQLRRHMVWMV